MQKFFPLKKSLIIERKNIELLNSKDEMEMLTSKVMAISIPPSPPAPLHVHWSLRKGADPKFMTTLVLVLQVVQLEKEYRQLAKAVEKVADEAHTANHKIATVRQTLPYRHHWTLHQPTLKESTPPQSCSRPVQRARTGHTEYIRRL